MRELLRSDVRRAVGAEHPRLTMDTLLLAASALIPFALSIAVIADGVHRRSHI
jgi:hypothetical protein